jgi:small subunit ribosomal protein S16
MLRIRLAKVGKKGRLSYRVVVSEARSKRDSNQAATIGFYDPNTQPPTFKIDKKEYQSWLAKGAQPSQAIRKLIKS